MTKGFDASTPLTRAINALGSATKGVFVDLPQGEFNYTDLRNLAKVGNMTGLPFMAGIKIAEAVEQDSALEVIRGSIFGVPYEDRPDLLE